MEKRVIVSAVGLLVGVVGSWVKVAVATREKRTKDFAADESRPMPG
jgi:hypothetical protein